MYANNRLQDQTQQFSVSRSAGNDIETARQNRGWQQLPLRSTAGGRLRNGVGNYEGDLTKIQSKQNVDLLENLFWYQEYGSARFSQGFRFSEGETFGASVLRFRDTLRQSARSSASSLQLW